VTRGFVPRSGPARVVTPWGWETSLTGWSGRGATLVATRPGVLPGAARAALVKTSRKIAKKVARVTVRVDPGPVVTSRPVGTRMGKGKGKPGGTRRWVPRGTTLVGWSRPVGVAVLAGRSPLGLVLRGDFW